VLYMSHRSRAHKSVSLQTSAVKLSCVLDLTGFDEAELDSVQNRRFFEWSLSLTSSESSAPQPDPVFLSRKTFFIVKGRTKTIDDATGTVLRDTPFEQPLLQSLHASIEVHKVYAPFLISLPQLSAHTIIPSIMHRETERSIDHY
jgi:hypothetical protein